MQADGVVSAFTGCMRSALYICLFSSCLQIALRADTGLRASAILIPRTAETESAKVPSSGSLLSLFTPTEMPEGSTAAAKVAFAGSSPTALELHLESSDPSVLTVPATVKIPPGGISAEFVLMAFDNTIVDGSRVVLVTATCEGFAPVSQSIIIRDNEAVAYQFGPLPGIVNVSSPLVATLEALDVEGNVIPNYIGTVKLNLVHPDGALQQITPITITFTGAPKWTGNIVIPYLGVTPLRLRVDDGDGHVSQSDVFDVMRSIPLKANDLVWDATRQRFYASLSSPTRIVAIDPTTLAITSYIATTEEPWRLALADDGGVLYVSFRESGTVSKIYPGSMSLISSFLVGSDPSYGPRYVSDMFVVPGNNNALVASVSFLNGNNHAGLAVYDDGVRRGNFDQTDRFFNSEPIATSADNGLFFALKRSTSPYPLRKMSIDLSGVHQISTVPTNKSVSVNDISSSGNFVVSNAGVAIDGTQMVQLGVFAATGPALPELAANRAYLLGQIGSTQLGSYDLSSLSNARQLTLPVALDDPGNLVRWGVNGLAFRTRANWLGGSGELYFVNSDQLVPSGPPADLALTVLASPSPATVGTVVSYTLQVTNLGPDLARSPIVAAGLSPGQRMLRMSPPGNGVTNDTVTFALPDLAVGASATLVIEVLPESAGFIWTKATVSSAAVDLNFANNSVTRLASVRFSAAPEGVARVRLPANNILYDSVRHLFWATIPSTAGAPLGSSLVSIDPITGMTSNPLPIPNPTARCMALSDNGRFLYFGIPNLQVQRLDLTTPALDGVAINVGPSPGGYLGGARDIETLEGDGRSFIMSTSVGAAVFDDTARRGNFNDDVATIDRIGKTGVSNVFVGYNITDSGPKLTELTATPTGLNVTLGLGNPGSLYNSDIHSSGDLALTSTGAIIDLPTLTVTRFLSVSGRAALDGPNRRAYMVYGASVRAFDTSDGSLVDTLPLPTTSYGDWASECLRWGPDGIAVFGGGELFLARWKSVIPERIDRKRASRENSGRGPISTR